MRNKLGKRLLTPNPQSNNRGIVKIRDIEMTTKRKRANTGTQEKTRADLQKVVSQVDHAISALRTVLGMPQPAPAQSASTVQRGA